MRLVQHVRPRGFPLSVLRKQGGRARSTSGAWQAERMHQKGAQGAIETDPARARSLHSVPRPPAHLRMPSLRSDSRASSFSISPALAASSCSGPGKECVAGRGWMADKLEDQMVRS